MTYTRQTCPRCGAVLSEQALAGLCPKCLSGPAFGFVRPDGFDETSDPLPFRRLGRYELLEEIARGGMGVVFKARQLDLNRIVAVKVILHGPFSSEEFVRRFCNEARAVATLQHPNIVAIHEFSEQDGHHFFSMDYVEGRNLAELVRERPLPARRAAGYLKTVAEAIDYAHHRGVLHRDLKPSNLLLDIFDQPRITDFGLAKLLDRDDDLTAAGQVLGSPNYMPPEQVASQCAKATSQGDVYSLGAILYHLLTGRPPFQGETLPEILAQVQHTPPLPPRRLNPSVPDNLQTICLKCLHKEPSRRYASAKHLADDLGRFLDDQPIHARPTPLAEKFQLWCRRRPMLAALSGALGAAVILGLTGVFWQWHRAERHAAGEGRLRRFAEEQTSRVRLNLYAADLNLAAHAIQQGDYGLARRTLAALRPAQGEADLRGFEWRYLWNLCRGDQVATFTGHQWIVTCAAFSPDGKLVVTGSQDGTARVWDCAGHKPVTTLPVTADAVWSTAFSSDGTLLMTAGADDQVKFWRTTDWQVAKNFPGRIASLSRVGSLVAISAASPFYWEPTGAVSLWDYRTGKKLREFEEPGRVLALSPDGARLAVAGITTGIELWDVASGRRLRTLPTSQPVWSLNFSPDSRRLVSAGWSSEVSVWELAGEQPPRRLLGHHLNVWSAIFSPDGTVIATAGSDQTIRLWDAVTLQARGILRGHRSEVWCAAFSPDGQSLASGGKDCNVMLWSARPPAKNDFLPNLNETRPIFSPDGTLIATINSGGNSSSTLWRVTDRQAVGTWAGTEVLGFAPDGTRFVARNTGSPDLEMNSLADQPVARVALAGADHDPVVLQGFSPAGDFYFAIAASGRIKFWDARTGGLIGTVQGPAPPIRAAILGPGGKYFALSVERENIVRLYECATGRELRLAGHRDFVSGLAFSTDSSTLATGSMDGTIGLWEAATGKALAVLPGHMEEVTDVAFSPDDRTLASISRGDSVKLWHIPTRRELLSLDFPEAGQWVRFSPDGRRLAVTTQTNSVCLFDAPSFAETDVVEP